MNYLKFKFSRQLGENIWCSKKLTFKQQATCKIIMKKSANRKQSDFSKKLQQMKKLAYFYGMRSLKDHMKSNRIVHQLDKQKSLLLHLESRLDVILVRIFFCSTLFLARQLISHGKILVNSTKVDIPSFLLRSGDVISIEPLFFDTVKGNIKRSFHGGFHFTNHQLNIFMPSQHLEVNYKTLNAILLSEPAVISFPYKIDLDLLF